ncbi:MAG TPA: valine--tRNA ligase, partial [Spirochaetes bacterium]|nr:valine--tRNA ligase [Spirochaetota bacterium]
MSKSLGNGIDPLEVIAEHGADALRFTIVSLAPIGLDVKLGFDKQQNDFLVGTRFCNKIWNASRYILMNLTDGSIGDISGLSPDLADEWILSRLQDTIERVNNDLEVYRFNDYAKDLYDFIWHDFCDWYLELSKINLYGDSLEKKKTAVATLVYVLSESLKLLHPIMPFITEEIWQNLSQDGDSIMVAPYPSVQKKLENPSSSQKMDLIQELVYQIRNIRGEMNIPPEKKVDIVIQTKDQKIHTLFTDYEKYISSLGKVLSVDVRDAYTSDSKCATSVGKGYELFIPLKGLIDLDKEKARLQKDLAKAEKELDKSQAKLSNEKFLSNADEAIVEKEKARLDQAQVNIEQINKSLSTLF